MIYYGHQSIDEDDIQEVVKVLRSDYLTQGPKTAEFEKAICEYTGAKYCVSVSSATAGLHIAVKSLHLYKGYEGITSPNTFVATPNSLIYNGLNPVFADIDKDTYNINPEEIKNKITKKTSVIMPVHFAGQSCDMRKIKEIADENKCYVIEDAAHAIGSDYCDSKVGSCKYSDMTVFSFHPVKTITTGEGGAITTNNKELYERLLLLRSHGIIKDKTDPAFYQMISLGFNYRMPDINAALGLSQLKKLGFFKDRRRQIILAYNYKLFQNENITIPNEYFYNTSCFHLYVVKINFDAIKKSRFQVMRELKEKGIITQVHYIPVHLQSYYKNNYGYKKNDYPIAEDYYGHCLSLPLYPSMTVDDVDYVCEKVNEVIK